VAAWLACVMPAVHAAASPAAELPSGPRPRASIILYVMDTVRADRLGVYGYPLATSPRLDRLARRGLVFDAAYSPGPSTTWSVPAFLTSRHPIEMAGTIGPQPAEHTLAEALSAAGYATACLQGNYGLIPELGFGRGFDLYRVLRKGTEGAYRYWTAREVNDEALAWISALPPDRPFFFYTQVMDAHFPYDPPPRYRGSLHDADSAAAQDRREVLRQFAATGLSEAQLEVYGKDLDAMSPDRYDEALAWLTDEFVRLVGGLKRLGRFDNTFIVLTADHGEPLGEHGAMVHGMNLHEEQVHVPLVVWGPGVRTGRNGDLVGLVDLAPTLLALVGVPVPASFRGESLLGARSMPPTAVGEMGPGPFNMPASQFVRRGQWKLIAYADRMRLFDLAADPKETRDVAAEHPAVVTELATELARRMPPLGAPAASVSTLPAPVKKDLEKSLRSLGYVE